MQNYLGDISSLVPDHSNKANISTKQVTWFFDMALQSVIIFCNRFKYFKNYQNVTKWEKVSLEKMASIGFLNSRLSKTFKVLKKKKSSICEGIKSDMIKWDTLE